MADKNATPPATDAGQITAVTGKTSEPTEQLDPEIRPISATASSMQIVECLLRTPGAFISRVRAGTGGHITYILLVIVLAAHLAYGLIVGSFSGGPQWYLAPAKIVIGTVLCGLICFPSLFIFWCLSGSDAKIHQVANLFLAMLALTAILLIGFAPVALVFSTSTNSVFFMGFLYLLFWSISIWFGKKVLAIASRLLKAEHGGYLKLWFFIFVITTLQMMTAVRPIVGQSDHVLPEGKKFFMQHWADTMKLSDRANR